MATDALFAQSEVVGKKMPEFFGKAYVALNKMKKAGDVERVGERDFRAPFLTQTGGRTGTFSADGGAFGRGTHAKGGVFTQTYFPLRINFEMSQLMIDATANPEVSRLNAFKRAMKDAIPEFALFCDQMWHGNGTAIIATAVSQSTVSSKTVYVMNTSGACRKLRVGQYVQVYDTSGTALNSGTAVYIEQINFATRSVYLSALIASAASTDTLCIDGATGSSPTGPNGLKYFHDSSTSGSTLGVARSTNYEVVSNSVAVAGVPTFMSGQQLIDQMLERRKALPTGMSWLASEKQKSNLYANVQNIARFDMNGGGGKAGFASDLNSTAGSLEFNYCGYPGMVDPHQDNDRMDLVAFSDWGRVQIKDVGYYEMNGNRFFTLYGADGSPSANTWFGLYLLENYICRNPGNGGYLSGLTLPTY